MTMADESKKEWYIVQTYSSYENKAKLALEERIAHSGLEEYFDQVFIPTETVTEVRNGKKRQVTRKFYNGYIFVKMREPFPAVIRRRTQWPVDALSHANDGSGEH